MCVSYVEGGVYVLSYVPRVWYRIAGYFRGVLIFVIFVVDPGVTKISTDEIFHELSRAKIWTVDVLL